MTVVSNIGGATGPSTAEVVVRVDSSADVRVAVSLTESGDPTWFGPVTPEEPVTGHFVARVPITGLAAGTHYHWHSEHNAVEDTAFPGELDTHPPVGEPASYTVAVIGDAGLTPETEGVPGSLFPTRMSDHAGFDTVRTHPSDPLMVCHLGDLHYYNPGDPSWSGDSLADYLRAWDDVLLQPRQHELYRKRSLQYVWDDHDYGPNDSDGNHDGKANAAEAYRLRSPHFPLAQDSGAIYHAFELGRVLYIASDTRFQRTPNAEPDDVNKTYLGAAQKLWMQELLSTTSARALVWLMPNPWLGTLDDTWGGFTTERSEIAGMLQSTTVPASNGDRTWAETMVMACADVHAVGLWSAGANPWGGFPGMLVASIDATPSAAGGGQYDLGFQGGRHQYGTVGIGDTGESITITLTAWQGNNVWGQQTVVFDAPSEPEPEPPPPTPGPVAVAEAVIRRHVTWLAVHRTTGKIITELPDLTGDPERQLSAYATTQITVPLTNGGQGDVPIEILEAATDGRSGALVAIVNDLPLWMGLPVTRFGGSDGNLMVPTATPESYLLKRRVKDHLFVGEDRARVAAALIGDAEDIEGPGHGLRLELDVEDTGDLIDIEYKATDRITVYDAIRDLCTGGLEFEVAFDWADSGQTSIVKIIRIKRRIGRISGVPHAVFESDAAGSVISYTLRESWADGDYANHIVSIGPGEGDDQPHSEPALDLAQIEAGVPIVEWIDEPGNNIYTPQLLQRSADSELIRTRLGASTLEIDAQLNAYPRLGVDALLGDQISHRLVGPRHPKHRPFVGARRMTGWRMDTAANTWTPKLVTDPDL